MRRDYGEGNPLRVPPRDGPDYYFERAKSYRDRRLDNGVWVAVSESYCAPIVAVNLW